jgi:hypothetical protein
LARTLQQQLDDVDAAIAAIETGGQSVNLDGATLTRASLATLYIRRDQLQVQINRAASGPYLVRLPKTGRP